MSGKIIFDLDGTLADAEHRTHYLKRPSAEKDWRAFYAECNKDAPCMPLIRTLLALVATGHDVEIWTGRSDEVAQKTHDWLTANGIFDVPVRMRKLGDHRPDTVLKKEWMDELSAKPMLAFEDRASVVAMWREHGIVCCQVAPGDF